MNPRRVPAKKIPQARIAFVQSSWHKDILTGCYQSFVATIAKLGYPKNSIELFEVPGAFEIPLHAKLLASSGRYAAIVANGLIVDGGIYRHEFVANAVIDGLMQVQLETEVPVFSVVLTPHQFQEQAAHHEFFRAHLQLKGVEAANACAETLRSLKLLKHTVG